MSEWIAATNNAKGTYDNVIIARERKMSVEASTSATSLPPALPNPITSPRRSVTGENTSAKTSPKAVVSQKETGIYPTLSSSQYNYALFYRLSDAALCYEKIGLLSVKLVVLKVAS